MQYYSKEVGTRIKILHRQRNDESQLAEILNTTTGYLLCGKVCVAGIENSMLFQSLKEMIVVGFEKE